MSEMKQMKMKTNYNKDEILQEERILYSSKTA